MHSHQNWSFRFVVETSFRKLELLSNLHGKYLFFESVTWPYLLVSIHKYVPADWMSVEIAEKKYFSWFLRLFHHQFGVVIYRIKFCWRANPLPVEILTNKWASIVSYDDSVWVKHRNYFENIRITQESSFRVITNQVINNAPHHPAGVRFTWMHSCCQNYSLSNCNLFRLTRKVGDN